MDAFNSQLQQWVSFFSSTAQVSGGLVGLVFVALTFNTRLLAKDGSSDLRNLAHQTFADFLGVLMVSLVMLVPHADPHQVAAWLVIIGLVGVIRIVRSLKASRRSAVTSPRNREVVRRIALSFAGNALLLGAGCVMLAAVGSMSDFWSLLFGGVLITMISGTRSAWLLVSHASED